MITNTLFFHYHNSPMISFQLFLDEGDTSLEAALEIRYLPCELFLSLPDIQDTEYWSTLYWLKQLKDIFNLFI